MRKVCIRWIEFLTDQTTLRFTLEKFNICLFYSTFFSFPLSWDIKASRIVFKSHWYLKWKSPSTFSQLNFGEMRRRSMVTSWKLRDGKIYYRLKDDDHQDSKIVTSGQFCIFLAALVSDSPLLYNLSGFWHPLDISSKTRSSEMNKHRWWFNERT